MDDKDKRIEELEKQVADLTSQLQAHQRATNEALAQRDLAVKIYGDRAASIAANWPAMHRTTLQAGA